jgi:hypothetical protein
MSPRPETAALALPRLRTWDYGDFPYGLEPLTMPAPGDPWLSDDSTGIDLRDCYLSLLGADLQADPVKPDELEQLFWFRWVTGHHVSFILWRLLAGVLHARDNGEIGESEAAEAIVVYVRAYSAMLLYTASTTSSVYADTIRPSMHRMHSAFSGTWSADYAPVRSFLRGRRVAETVPGQVEDVLREIRLSRRVHADIGARLVADGRSLLQRQMDDTPRYQPQAWSTIFDCFFLTVRAPASCHDLVAQMLRRCKAVLMDLATNGLYPASADYRDLTSGDGRASDVLACEEDMSAIVLRAVGRATQTQEVTVCSTVS